MCGASATLTTRMEEGDYVIKAVRNALGPNPTCDPHPPQRYKGGAELFEHKYADAFYTEYPDLKDIPFSILKTEHANNPVIQAVCKEYTVLNNEYKAKVREWSDKWPDHAAKVLAYRKNATTKRNGRKARQLNEMNPMAKRHKSVDEVAGVMSLETERAHLEFAKMCYAQSSQLTEAANMITRYIYGEHAKRVRELEYERQYIN
jgi:hypothetical protein